ncbi:NAD(P)/FAD-dependent oxidoreductase [Pseudomonas sp. LP_7_YM]|uniref:NAD(P)/FAD-dependent oxidoreductase n=1 Tax=Pseudomonas sp. LP_7_YM TaxID=2485137 RepID=UPI00106110E6|nr:NAD(P)/FAD-dependent oxidoreductase [Pseudomonas sp. LP_7_YM]TDV67772.1 pyruvate/2-oxoglutarate dehydrogenase complex dihydrolipoamide dehydrogenase (E3) component [Pseudomonas sp. LP_7_YM]
MNDSEVDLIIIGAGPAGISAALEASAHGLDVVLLDEQASPGGQIWRNVTQSDARTRQVLGCDYSAGRERVETLLASEVRYHPNAAVWQVTDARYVHVLIDGEARVLRGRQLLIATGAMERPMPIPGWTLPGVMTAGAGQILLKSAAMVPRGPVILAGCGPLLYLLAVQYLRAGIRVEALVDTSERRDAFKHLRQLRQALAGWRDLLKGVSLLATLKRAGIKHYHAARNLRVEGERHAQALRFDSEGQSQKVSASLILLHQGVVPHIQISQSLRADHDWNEQQLCWVARRDSWGETSVPGIFIAGDGGAIGGAHVAAIQGRLAALAIACRLQKIDESGLHTLSKPWRRLLSKQSAARPLIDALYRPHVQNRIPQDDTIVCRCEEVSAGAIRGYVDLGCLGPNQAKAFGRCGMGPCQGRQCGLSVSEIIAEHRNVLPTQVGYYRIRPPLKPITLAQLASERALEMSPSSPPERSPS